ncbi:MAG TPA: hypothetical protein VJ740_15720 [Hyphomicrobiaceae bacterium]|nr:hypothetical protein [Hyphomicrobiaceae bacterium]
MSLIEVARLSEAQQAALAAYGARWSALRSRTDRCDRPAAEATACAAYAAAGFDPPRRIVWTAGPVELAARWVRDRASAGENVRAQVVDQVCRKAETAVDRAVGLAVRVSLAGEPRLSRVPAFCTSIDDAVLRDCERVRPAFRERLASMFAPHRRGLLSFAASGCNPQSVQSLGPLEYFHDVCGLERQTERVRGLWQLAAHAGWIVPHRHVCWLAERPEVIRHDAAGRLHCADGPAVAYADGWSSFAWKGVLVPRWVIERPELVTVRAIASVQDPQVRRCMIEVLTPERFIANGGACRVAQDETGILWRQRWRWEAWAAVEVINGSPEPDGSYKHYFLQVPANMRSAREAVAWTYGLPEQRYRPIIRT